MHPNKLPTLEHGNQKNGRVTELNQCKGEQSHLWGKRHAHGWLWAHCNAFENSDLVIELLIVTVKRGPFLLPKIGMLRLFGGHYDFEISNLNILNSCEVIIKDNHCMIHFKTPHYDITLTFTYQKSEFIRADYANPNGHITFCDNTEIAGLSVVIVKRTGTHSIAKHQAASTAHFELGGSYAFAVEPQSKFFTVS